MVLAERKQNCLVQLLPGFERLDIVFEITGRGRMILNTTLFATAKSVVFKNGHVQHC